jgi:hypothetical protein
LTDELRSEFKHSYSVGSVESENLQGPVVAVADSTDAEHLYDIHEQQVKVTKAKGAYDKARAVYTGQVLAGFVRSGGARL